MAVRVPLFQPLTRLWWRILAAILAFVALTLLSINLYIQSPGAHRRICDALGRGLGLPVDLFRASYAPWSGLVLQGVVIGAPEGGMPLLRADRLRVHPSYLQLLRRRLVIKRVVLQRVDVRLPAGLGASLRPQGGGAEELAPAPATSEEGAPGADRARPLAGSGGRSRGLGPMLVQLQRFKVADGTVTFLNRDGSPAATIHGVECSARLDRRVYVGRINAESAAFADALAIEDVGSPFRLDADQLEMPEMRGRTCGGTVQGDFRVTWANPYPYALNLRLADVNVTELAAQLEGVLERAHGTLSGSLEMRGALDDAARNSGRGSVQLASGVLEQYPLLQEIGRWTQIDELQRLQLEDAHANFHVIGPDVRLDELRLQSRNCDVRLWGDVLAMQRLALNGRLTINQFLSQKVPNELEENFVTNADGRTRSLEFKVDGPATRPQTDLFDRIIGDKKRLLRKLMGSDRRERGREVPPRDEGGVGPSAGQ